MDLSEVLEGAEREAKREVRKVSVRLGRAERFLDKDDLEQQAMEKLLTLHRPPKGGIIMKCVRIIVICLALAVGCTSVQTQTKQSAPDQKADSETLSKPQKKGTTVWPVRFAQVLPLPGKYAGLVKKRVDSESVQLCGIHLSPGEDATTKILPVDGTITMKPSDIQFVIQKDGFRTEEDIPMALEFDAYGRLSGFDYDLLGLLTTPRAFWIGDGTVEVPVADPETKRVVKTIKYTFQAGASISYDVFSRGLVWRGIAVHVTQE